MKNNQQQDYEPNKFSIEEIRSRLKALGYLESPVERFLSRPSGGPWRTGFTVTAKLALLIGFLLAGLTTASTLLADPGFIENSLDIFLFLTYLGAAYSLGAFCLVLIPALLWVRKKKRSAGMISGGTLRSAVLCTLTASVFCAYLLGWWHLVMIGSQQILPFGVVSLSVLAAIALISLMAGRMIGLVYFLLAGVPESSRSRQNMVARGYIFSLVAVLLIESAWAIGFFRHHSADHTLNAALRDYSLRPLPILLIGLDRLDSELLFRLSGVDNLPNLTRLIDGGFTVELTSQKNYLAPQVWTTVATGVKPEQHGINHFTLPVLRGMSRPPRLGNSRPGLKLVFEQIFPFLQLVRTVPLSASSRMTKTLWEIIELFRAPAGVVNWWASWPACSSKGFTVSERTFSKIALVHQTQPIKPSTYYNEEVFPPAEFDSLVDLRAELEEPFDSVLTEYRLISALLQKDLPQKTRELIRSIYFADYFHTRAAAELARRHGVKFLALYIQGPDILSRLEERTDLVDPESLQGLIPEYFRFIDRLLGELIDEYQPTGMVVAICDPGKKGRLRELKGVVIFNGVDVRKGFRKKVPIYLEDVAPTILYLIGLPIARDMCGKALTEAGMPGPGGAMPLRFVTSYGPPPLFRESLPDYRHDTEEIQRFRSLGYLK